MKKVYKLIDLDCANCAAKMENGIKELPEVEDCTVSFLTQKMTITRSLCHFLKTSEVKRKSLSHV